MYKKDYSWNPSTCTCENSKYLKSIANTSAIACDNIIYVMGIASTQITNTIATDVSIMLITKKVRCKIDCYISHAVLLVIILLLIIAITSYHYVKHWSKQRGIDTLTI